MTKINFYVKEFPDTCWDCPMHCGENGECKMLGMYTDYVPKKCPLILLEDKENKENKGEK